MSRPNALSAPASESFPRVSGDEPLSSLPDEKWAAFSPRERG